MARDVQQAVEEEEARELEEATDLEEQAQPKEFDDEAGENTAATASALGSGLEFICVKCGRRSRVMHVNTTGVHCGRRMLLVDHAEKRSYPFDRTRVTILQR